uniref:Uncharacterized protein n=1 Tax=Magallana gigas TaxID=29159 RepID=A0A8W8NZ58_MAGGI
MVTHVRDVAVPDVSKTFATKMAPALGAVHKIGREINVINAFSHITDLTVPNRAVSIAYKAHATMRRGSAHMGAKQDSTETCATVNVGGVHRAVTGKWGIVANIVQLEDLGNCMKEHATKGV